MGQVWEEPVGPDGWSERAEDWITPQGMSERITWSLTAPGLLLETLPDPRLLNENRIVTLKSNSGYPSFDMLQTKVLLQMAKNNWTRLAITSPTVGCGKTTVVSNLAIGFLRQTDKRVIVLEMDMRRPMMSSMPSLLKSATRTSRQSVPIFQCPQY